MRLSDDELRAALRAEAAGHEPDREAMLDRIAMSATAQPVTRRRAAGHAPRRGPKVRMAAAATAVVALFAGGGFANWALAGSNDAAPPAPAPVPALTSAPQKEPSATSSKEPSEKPSKTPSRTPSSAAPSTAPSKTPATATPSPTLTKGQPGFTRTEQGPLWSDGSVVAEGSSVITLKSTEELTSLDVVIRVARTEGLVSRGATKQTPGGSVTASVTEEADALLYRFTLASADTLDPGTYTFTAKYTAAARNAGGDTYEVTASTASAPSLDVYGNFYASTP
ncbi:cytoskeletal protein RodZ [Actinoplanes lutulentus]|uniref:Uncharacterized protein n=1 Tax=Actinoplanes lutulentus TaxID=1287878 RepID=A0A327ZF79_9ACTN|nr:hypothetical protein [Actinoplanes lutulentus]MBB2942534.1 cytoskeletal protein RodZ [Actinoplanes lutulentus]RAK38115.1 hypothetical protein B0I29_10561 [Actinoplanes lutulentus]